MARAADLPVNGIEMRSSDLATDGSTVESGNPSRIGVQKEVSYKQDGQEAHGSKRRR